MNRRDFLQLTSTAAGNLLLTGCVSTRRPELAEVAEGGIAELQEAMAAGRLSAVSLTRAYLKRIERWDARPGGINSVLELNPDVLALAAASDRERTAQGPRGPLHGIPILLKDNIDTHDKMMTTAGSLALLGSIPPRDATVTERLRAAGAVILGKANLSEWANFRGRRSTSGWSARGGQTRNPHDPNRNPSGSSSGSGAAVSASFCAVAIGTETDGSIVSPASHCGIVGLKPTVGAISRAGIIPIAASQDTAGPMTRTVRDAAILFGVLAGPDPRDEATAEARDRVHADYTQFLDPEGLRGARIGVARRFFDSRARASAVFGSALEVLRQGGAELIDPADLATHGRFGAAEHQVLLYEFKHGLNAYLESLGGNAPVRSLEEIIAFNESHRDRELMHFGQEHMIEAQRKGPLTETEYLEARATARRLAGREGIDALMDEHRLDAIVAPTSGPAGVIDYLYGDRGEGGSSSPAAVAGYPSITVPAGDVFGLPVGISFFGRAWSEPVLLKLAFAFEQRAQARRAPRLTLAS
jgi:amidase